MVFYPADSGPVVTFRSPYVSMDEIEFKAARLERRDLGETLAKERRKSHLLCGWKRGQVTDLSRGRPKGQLGKTVMSDWKMAIDC